MTRSIESHQFPVDLRQIQMRNEKLFAVEDRIKHVLCVWADDRAAAALEPRPVASLKFGAIAKFAWQVVGRHHQAGGQNKTAAFEGVVSTGQLVQFVDGRPDGDMNVFT